jgi:hypothetical protein
MLIVSLVFSAALFGFSLFVAGLASSRAAYLVCWFGLLAALPFCMFFLPTYALHALALAVFGTACSVFNLRPRTFAYGSLAVFVGCYTAIGIPTALDIWRAEKDYPVESLDQRLVYEPSRPKGTKPAASQGSPDVQWPEDRVWDIDARNASLERLHRGFVETFVNSPGFGVERMPLGVSAVRSADPIRNAPPLPLPEPIPEGYLPSLSEGDVAGLTDAATPETEPNKLMKNYHHESVRDFANPLAFGFVPDRKHLQGFVSHRFTKYPHADGPAAEGRWRIENLELISLLRHPEPVAYLSGNLPRMDELRDAPTRPLDGFEIARLEQLRAGRDLSAAAVPRRIRMLGAIRARDTCLKCHNAEPKDLLGAFSYDLRLDLPASR